MNDFMHQVMRFILKVLNVLHLFGIEICADVFCDIFIYTYIYVDHIGYIPQCSSW